jgi:hypothetical protein
LANSSSKPAIPTHESVADSTDHLSSPNSQALREALNHSPEVRPEVVERGHRLAVDPNYPPREIIMSLAKLLSNSADLSEES